MKLSATREQILAPLQSVIGVVERRQTMPVLSNVLLAARNNRVSVTGTDLEVELVAPATPMCSSQGTSPCRAASCSISSVLFLRKQR